VTVAATREEYDEAYHHGRRDLLLELDDLIFNTLTELRAKVRQLAEEKVELEDGGRIE
jgi:hypothetical protein